MWIWLQIFQCFRTHLVYCIHFRSDWPNFPNWIGEWMLKNAILTLGKINAFHILCCEFEMALPPKRIQNMDSTWLTFQAFCSYIPRYVYYSAYKRVVQYSTTLVCFEKKEDIHRHRAYLILTVFSNIHSSLPGSLDNFFYSDNHGNSLTFWETCLNIGRYLEWNSTDLIFIKEHE